MTLMTTERGIALATGTPSTTSKTGQKKRQKVELRYPKGTYASIIDIVPDTGLGVHKLRVWNDDTDKPTVLAHASRDYWVVTHLASGKRACPLPFVSKEAATAYATETSFFMDWTLPESYDFTTFYKAVMAVWNSVNQRFWPDQAKSTTQQEPLTESAST